MRRGKLVIATVLAGIGAGMVHLADDHKAGIKRHLHNAKRTIAYDSSAFSNLNSDQKAQVLTNFYRIIPKSDLSPDHSFYYQIDVQRYMKVLHYLSHRYEFHATHASKVLHIPLIRMRLLDLAVTQQKMIDLTDASTEYVRQNVVDRAIHCLNVHYSKASNVNPIKFNHALKTSIAHNMFKI